jgi:hypothetical protein
MKRDRIGPAPSTSWSPARAAARVSARLTVKTPVAWTRSSRAPSRVVAARVGVVGGRTTFQTGCAAGARRRIADHEFPGVHGLQCLNELAGGQCLGQVSVGSVPERVVDEVGVEVPGVDHHAVGARVAHEDSDLVLCGLGLGERVVQHDVHDVVDSLVRVDLLIIQIIVAAIGVVVAANLYARRGGDL